MNDKTAGAEAILAPDSAKKLFVAVMITSFIGPFATSGINVAIPALAHDFGAAAGELSWVVFGMLLGSAMFILPAGKVADIYGRKKVYIIGLWLFALSFLLGACSTSIMMLNILRFIQGAVMSLIFGPGMALLISSHSPKERGKVIGYSAAATYSGLSMGPVICGFLCDLASWRGIFVITGAVVFISIWLMRSIQEEWYGDKGASLDFKGSLCYLAAAPLWLCGLSKITEGNLGVLLLVAGVLGLILFFRIEAKAEHPCLDVKLFRGNPVFTFSNLAAMLHYSSTFALSFLMSLYLQVIVGYSAYEAGMIILLQPVVMALLSPKAGALSDRLEPGKVASVGMAITGSGLWGMSFLAADTPVWVTGLLLMWIGLGFALFSSPNNNAIMGAVSPKYYGTASSLLAAMRLMGQSTSMAVVTLIIALCQVHSLTGSDNIQLMGAVQTAFRVFGCISIVAIFMSLVRNKSHK